MRSVCRTTASGLRRSISTRFSFPSRGCTGEAATTREWHGARDLQEDRRTARWRDHRQKQVGQGFHLYRDTASRAETGMEDDEMSCFTLLMADDDPDDRFLTEQACLELRSCGDLRFVEDGEELMHYLRQTGKYADPTVSPRPALILLDLNMPKKDGRQALVEIKTDP
jgi:hypothetical protein